MEASRDSFIPNFAVVVQIVEIHTVGIRRKCAFFRQTILAVCDCKNTFFFSFSKNNFLE